MKNITIKFLGLCLMLSAFGWSCSEDESLNPSAQEVSPPQGASNELLTVTGKDLSNVETIFFEKENIKAVFNPNFNSAKAILFRVPADAVPGSQNIIFTNKDGTEFTIPFNVLGFANIISVSNYNFSANDEIVLTGKNLDDVTNVVFTGTTEEVEIISKTATTLTLKFPATTLTESTLTITNEAGTSRTLQSFVALDNAALVMFKDDLGAGFEVSSWGAAGKTTDVFKTGTASFSMKFFSGGWNFNGFANWGTAITASDDYQDLSFWIKGAEVDLELYTMSDQSENSWDAWAPANKIAVPANVWTYVRIPVASLKLWTKAPGWNQIGWRLRGEGIANAADRTFYVDDVIFIK